MDGVALGMDHRPLQMLPRHLRGRLVTGLVWNWSCLGECACNWLRCAVHSRLEHRSRAGESRVSVSVRGDGIETHADLCIFD